MEGKRNSLASSHILVNYSGPSFSYLPMDVIVNVLLRLSIKMIVVCKLVCKTWRDLISQPEFAKHHFDQAQAYPLVQVSSYKVLQRMLYLVQPDEEDFERKFQMCGHSEYKSRCDCHVKFELDTKFKIPLRSLQKVFDGEDQGRNNCIGLGMRDLKYRVVNSCNGLLCLSSSSYNEPLVVCNPVTGEFINLPETNKNNMVGQRVLCGLGFSPATTQYKVIRIFQHSYGDDIGAEVHTIGTTTWKDIKVSGQKISDLSLTYLNGFLYWPCGTTIDAPPSCLISFDIENECFGSISAPPVNSSEPFELVHTGILGGELSLSCYFPFHTEVWVMKHNGPTNVWSKVLSIRCRRHNRLTAFGACQPIKYLNDGAVLSFDSNTNCLIYKHPNKCRFRYFRFWGTKAQLAVTAHVPSFVSLKDALAGHNVEVLNLSSRCANMKLQDEDTRIFVREIDIRSR